MYVDASDSCNTLSFHLSEASTVTPMWSIIVTQYSNDYANKAPPNCLQYHFGAATGQIRSFNWNEGNGRHLANQNQLICIRREKTMNRICYSQAGGAVVNDFLISSGVAGDATSMQSGLLGVSRYFSLLFGKVFFYFLCVFFINYFSSFIFTNKHHNQDFHNQLC